jgi:hypothetical protein
METPRSRSSGNRSASSFLQPDVQVIEKQATLLSHWAIKRPRRAAALRRRHATGGFDTALMY